MDGAFEKFSVYDFFNLIIGGGLFLIGLHILGFSPLLFLIKDIKMPDNDLIILISILLVCYVIGFILQAIESWLDKDIFKIQSKMTGAFLLDNNKIITNIEKLKIYQNKAKQHLKRKNIIVKNNEFTKYQCEYFFSYCSYYIQIYDKAKKAEKMRGIKGLASIWMVCFFILFLIGLSHLLYLMFFIKNLYNILFNLVISLIFLSLSVISYYSMKKNLKYWIRMILGLYEVCSDLSKKK